MAHSFAFIRNAKDRRTFIQSESMFLTFVALATLSAVAALSVELARGLAAIDRLDQISPDLYVQLPRVSVVAAARDEEKHPRRATSLLRLDYPDVELIAYRERTIACGDRTAAILTELARVVPGLRVVTIGELPDGWLGKNNALHRGAAVSGGVYFVHRRRCGDAAQRAAARDSLCAHP